MCHGCCGCTPPGAVTPWSNQVANLAAHTGHIYNKEKNASVFPYEITTIKQSPNHVWFLRHTRNIKRPIYGHWNRRSARFPENEIKNIELGIFGIWRNERIKTQKITTFPCFPEKTLHPSEPPSISGSFGFLIRSKALFLVTDWNRRFARFPENGIKHIG